jgi:hypothetical protein
MPQSFYFPGYQALSSSGTPLGGAKLNFFKTGTTTATPVYADAARTTTLSNPVVADAQGRFPQIYPDPAVVYRARLSDSSNVQQWQEDGVSLQLFPRIKAEIDANVVPVNYAYPPGDVLRYGADREGNTNVFGAFDAAIKQCIGGGGPVVFPPGTYLLENQVIADNVTSLAIFGYGATIDFRTDSPIKLGDHTVNGSSQFTQTSQTCSNIVIAGLTFKPGANGWDGNRFAHAQPINLSSAANVVIRDCRFEDWDFAAIDLNAPCRHVLIEHCYFSASQEGDVTYGVRPFAHVAGASTDNYNESNGTLAYAAPTSFHQDITVRDCYFYQCSHSIISWNVHGASYVNNVFEKPTIRTVSVTAWNFDVLVAGNKHIIANNSVETVSTAVAVGIGSRRVIIRDEHFYGALSGSGVNNSMKLIDIAGVNEGIVVADCQFDVTNCANIVVIGPNVGATISGNHFHRAPTSTRAVIVINDQTASPVGTPGFNQPEIRIVGNVDYLTTRFVELSGTPPGTTSASAIVIQGNMLKTQLGDGFVVTNTATAGWKVRARDNQFAGGAPFYSRDFGTAKIVWQDADDVVLSGATTFSSTTSASVSLSVTLPGTGYKVVASANENKTFWVSSKTATGWTWNASSSSVATVDWRVVI